VSSSTGNRVQIPLRLPGLAVEGCDVQRSGFRWLRAEGQRCRAGDVVAWCHIGLEARPGYGGAVPTFLNESRELEVALAVRHAGRLRKTRGVSRGGFLDQQIWYHLWSPDTTIGHLECSPQDSGAAAHGSELRPLFLTGRRIAPCAEVRSGILSGWHDRCRAWWADGPGDFGTVLSLGVCEQAGVFRGEQGAFFELFAKVPGPAHVVFNPDDILVPSAPMLLQQMQQSPADRAAITEDLAANLGPTLAAQSRAGAAVAADWIFAGVFVNALTRSPLMEQYDLITASGARRVGPADAVVLSLANEYASCLRHKRLGYLLTAHFFRLTEIGPALTRWLTTEFEVIRRTPEDKHRDLLMLIDAVSARASMQFLIMNSVTTRELDDVYCYSPFDKPLRDTLASIHAKELNLMLCQLARERDVSIVDVDALAAEHGVNRHVPDGIH
jgi:hypothetical protein